MADKKISALTAATTPLVGTEVLPIVQSGSTVKVANNDLRPKQIQSNATSGVLQVAGPAAAATRVMTTPDANFTVARTDAAQTFTGTQDVNSGNINVKNGGNVGGAGGFIGFGANNANDVMGLIKGSLANTASGADQGSLVIQTRPIGAGLQALRDIGVLGADGNITVSIGNLVIGTSGKGIDFSAAGGNVLTTYVEGTHSPAATSSSGTLTTVTQSGSYVKIGKMVNYSFRVKIDDVGTGSGDINITLPFACNLTPTRPMGCGRENALTGNTLQVRTGSDGSANASILAGPALANGWEALCTITYQATT